MNSIIRNLIIAAPLATAALTMVPTSAMAADGPVIIAQPQNPQPPIDDIAIPEPKPPVEPKDKIALPEPKPPVDDKAPKPKPTQPDGPDVITNPEPCPTHGGCGDDDKDGPGNGGGDDSSDDDTTPAAEVNKIQADDTVAIPNRVDAGLAAEQSDGGLELVWLLAGGALVTATGAGFALRKRHTA